MSGMPDEPWVINALCAQTDPEAFFPDKGESTREAKKMCGRCEVTEECLRHALDNDERFGVWGGLSERERRRLKRTALTLIEGPTTKETIMAELHEQECTKCATNLYSSRSARGWCDYCEAEAARAADPVPVPEPEATEVPISQPVEESAEFPEYVFDIAVLLTKTENHGSPLVRSIRKIAVQAAIALDEAYKTSGSDEETTRPPSLSSNLSSVPTPSEPEPKQTRHNPVSARLEELGISRAELREWARKNDVDVSDRGALPMWLVDQYAAAAAAA